MHIHWKLYSTQFHQNKKKIKKSYTLLGWVGVAWGTNFNIWINTRCLEIVIKLIPIKQIRVCLCAHSFAYSLSKFLFYSFCELPKEPLLQYHPQTPTKETFTKPSFCTHRKKNRDTIVRFGKTSIKLENFVPMALSTIKVSSYE